MSAGVSPPELDGLPRDDLVDWLSDMILIRRFEETADDLSLRGKVAGGIHPAIGQEAVAVGVARALRGADIVTGTHRSHHHALAKGMPPDAVLAELAGKATGSNGGRGGSMHLADFDRGLWGSNGIVGAGLGIALGAALGASVRGTDQVVAGFFGDGGANTGRVWEFVNLAAIWKLPLIAICENNLYAVETPSRTVTGGGSVAARAAGFGLPAEEVDGQDVLEVFRAVSAAAARARSRRRAELPRGPHLPLPRPQHRRDHPLPNRGGGRRLARQARPDRPPRRAAAGGRTPRRRPTAGRVGQEVRGGRRRGALRRRVPLARPRYGTVERDREGLTMTETMTETAAATVTYSQAFQQGMREEMQRDGSIFVVGTDIYDRGGHFAQLKGLGESFGHARVRDAPISEAAMVAAGVGAALNGCRPVVDLNFMDFAYGAMDEIVNQAAKIRYMWGRPVPLVVRATAGVAGGGAQHNNSLQAWFASTPGLSVVFPSRAWDVKGLIKSALRSDDPVIFMMHKRLSGARGEVGGPDELVPIGSARVTHSGDDVTVVTYGYGVVVAGNAAEKLAAGGITCDVVDLRTLFPLDMDTVLESVRRTGRVVVLDEAPRHGSLAAEIAARIQEEAFFYLDQPVRRVTGAHVPIPHSPPLLDAVLPSEDDLALAVRAVLEAGDGAA